MKIYTVLYFGTWGYGKAGLEALLAQSNIHLQQVFTKWDLNKEDSYLNQIYNLAELHDVPLINTRHELMSKTDFRSAVIDAGKADFIISCCYDRIFTTDLLQLPDIAALNVHPSLLPKYRGIKPLENAIIHGESRMGVTLHELVKELDAGDIILQKSAPIQPQQTFGELYNQQCQIIKDILALFFTNPEHYFSKKHPQNHLEKTDAPRLPFAFDEEDTVTELIQRHQQYTYQH